jgi:hypothetical protein
VRNIESIKKNIESIKKRFPPGMESKIIYVMVKNIIAKKGEKISIAEMKMDDITSDEIKSAVDEYNDDVKDYKTQHKSSRTLPSVSRFSPFRRGGRRTRKTRKPRKTRKSKKVR